MPSASPSTDFSSPPPFWEIQLPGWRVNWVILITSRLPPLPLDVDSPRAGTDILLDGQFMTDAGQARSTHPAGPAVRLRWYTRQWGGVSSSSDPRLAPT